MSETPTYSFACALPTDITFEFAVVTFGRRVWHVDLKTRRWTRMFGPRLRSKPRNRRRTKRYL